MLGATMRSGSCVPAARWHLGAALSTTLLPGTGQQDGQGARPLPQGWTFPSGNLSQKVPPPCCRPQDVAWSGCCRRRYRSFPEMTVFLGQGFLVAAKPRSSWIEEEEKEAREPFGTKRDPLTQLESVILQMPTELQGGNVLLGARLLCAAQLCMAV